MRGEVEALIAKHGLGGRVRITGWISSDRVREEILAARGLVQPSFAEGLPVVIMEAMVLRRPVLTTYVAGIPELVQPGKNGWLFPAGDVDARVWVRIEEVGQSLALIEQILDRLPAGAIISDPIDDGDGGGEGLALVEGFRGDVLAWVRLGAGGSIAACHLRDPSWFQWPLLEAAIEGNIVADFPLCNKSFNCSYSGHDL